MPYRGVRKPVAGPAAFQRTGNAAALSRSAILLMMGRQMRGDDDALIARSEAAGVRSYFDPFDHETTEEFPIPRIRASGERYESKAVRRRLMRSGGRRRARESRQARERRAMRSARSEMADEMFRNPNPECAAHLMEACLFDEDELTRVCAATSYFEVTDDPESMIEMIVGGTASRDQLVRDVSATALARIAPEHPRLAELLIPGQASGGDEPSHTSLLVHGTFARNGRWWQPGGDFHTYIRNDVRSDLYNASDRFDWSGGYSNRARALGARELRDWVSSRGLDGLTVFGHSHGANIAMLATRMGMEARDLILLSCPVDWQRYSPDFNNVNRVISIRVRFDVVIAADFGGQMFNHPRVEENVLPIWFNHSASHEPSVWRRHDVPSKL